MIIWKQQPVFMSLKFVDMLLQAMLFAAPELA